MNRDTLVPDTEERRLYWIAFAEGYDIPVVGATDCVGEIARFLH